MPEQPDTPHEGFVESVKFIIKSSQALSLASGSALTVNLLLLPSHWGLRGLWDSHQEFPGCGLSLVPRISALQGMLGGCVAAGTLQVSKLHLFSCLTLSSHNFLSVSSHNFLVLCTSTK